MRQTIGQPDPERDRTALEEERLKMIADDCDDEWEETGLKPGLQRLAEVLRKIKEQDNEKKNG